MDMSLGYACAAGIPVFTATLAFLMRTNPAPAKENRLHPRSAIDSECQIYWQDAGGNNCSAAVRGINMSETGVCFKTSRPPASGSLVTVIAKQYHLFGSGYIRHTSRKRGAYLVGLEFRGPLVRSIC